MNKTYHFVAGMPRSGSTLLCNILGQNPRFNVTSTSGIMDIMFSVRNNWDQLIEFKAAPNDEGKLRVLRGILDSYYGNVSEPVVFDKCRGWLAYLEMAENVLDRKAKVLVPVRDLRDVLSSFEKIWRNTSSLHQLAPEAAHYFDFQSIEGRCRSWLRTEQPVGLAYTRIKDAVQRGFADRMHFVRFEDLTSRPAEVMAGIYDFLEEEPFDHDFDNVKQITWENDAVHGIKGLHDIRPKVEPIRSDAAQVLGKATVDAYKGPYVWDEVKSNGLRR